MSSGRARDEWERAREWCAGKGPDAPDVDDVEIAVRLEVRDPAVVQRMLWSDRDGLLAAWDELMAVLEKTAQVQAGDLAPKQTPVPPNNTATTDQASGGLRGIAATRYAALVEFVASRRENGEDVSNVNDANLREAAESDRVSFKRLGPFLRKHERVVRELLDAVEEPADPEARETDVSTASLAGAGGEGGAGSTPPDEHSLATPTAGNAQPVLEGEAEPTDFAPWVYGSQDDPGSAALPVTFAVLDEGGLNLSWPEPPTDGLVRVYRVVTNDQYLPSFSPELGDLLVATYERQAVDTRPVEQAMRHVAVWVNEGETERDARNQLPRLYAVGSCVIPVRNCVIREDEGTVIGQWQVAPGVERVDVLRVPAAVAATQQHYNPNYLLPATIVGVGGFTDDTAQPGQAYEYQVYALAADIEGVTTHSPPVVREVRVQAVLEKIEDLRVTPQEGQEDLYDLEWTRPALGKVEIYRSETPPTSGIGAQVIDRAALSRQPGGLTPELLLTRQLASADGVDAMRGVPWPHGWSRAYFTAVTVLAEDQIQVGNVVILNRSAPVEHLRLVERVDEQFLTFAWPPGAGQVRVYVGSLGTPLVPDLQEPVAELFEDEYVKQGGAHLKAPLPAGGCVVHVVAVSFAEARATLSAPRSVDYPGLLRVRYDVTTEEHASRSLLSRGNADPRSRRVTASADGSVDNLTLVLAHQPHRLPLHPRDGQELARRTVSMPANTPVSVFEGLNLDSVGGGYIRLFAEVPPDRAHLIAILDPTVAKLAVGAS